MALTIYGHEHPKDSEVLPTIGGWGKEDWVPHGSFSMAVSGKLAD